MHTNYSAFQLGLVIIQKGKTIAFYGRKLTDAQQQYIVTDRELLSIVETLKDYKNILLGHKSIICADHRNLTSKNFNANILLKFILILVEYGLDI